MRRAAGVLSLLLVGLFTACGDDKEPLDGLVPVSTLAYVVSGCREGAEGFSGSQALWLRQGERTPVKVAEYPWGQPPIVGYCNLYAQFRVGGGSVVVGAFQRLGVSPDGSLLVFEVNEAFTLLTHVIPDEQEGIFVVHADGTGLRKVGPPSRDASFRFDPECAFGAGPPGCAVANIYSTFDFSPDGRRVVYTDRGPSKSDAEAAQVFTLDITTREQRQITRLPPLPVCTGSSGDPADCVKLGVQPLSYMSFLDDTTIAFTRGQGESSLGGGLFTVRADGTEEPQAVPVVALSGGVVVPVFEITGAAPSASTILVPGVPENEGGCCIFEAFAIEGTGGRPGDEPRVLQLTNYRRWDTGNTRMSADGQRVFFRAGGDPLGTNPAQQCQWFSIDRLGTDLRQLTDFDAGGERGCSCESLTCPPPGCSIIGDQRVDQITGSLVFYSTCDPFGTNPYGGQIFAMRPDGSGMRQLTDARGIVEEADGTIDVELPGPFAIVSRLR